MALFCSSNNAAQRIYRKRTIAVALTYTCFFFTSAWYVRHHHPEGARLYLAAVLPTISIVGMLYVVGRYLREETDEFVRDQFIRSALWAIAAVMAYIMFFAFLRTFGWTGKTPAFAEYFIFCLTLLIAKFTYKLRNRAATDE